MSKRRISAEELKEIFSNVDVDDLGSQLIEQKGEEAPMEAWFLGPKAEQAELWMATLEHIFSDYVHWRRNYFPLDPIILDRQRLKSHEIWGEKFKTNIDSILNLLKAHFPFYSPRYNAHMLSEQSLPGVMGYFAAMLYNPNNVTEEAAPITVELELEVGKMVAEMLGYNRNRAWAHLTSGGTIANMEALWVARMAQFVPLIVRDFCTENGVDDFEITTPNGEKAMIVKLSTRELLSQSPRECVSMLRNLAAHLIGREGDGIFEKINDFYKDSRFNVSTRGVHAVLTEIGLKPVVFVSETAHYSIKKAANVLGYGEDAIRFIGVDSHFRMDADMLAEEIFGLADDEYIAAVIAIIGSTEEGAVDPIHKVRFIRKDYQRDRNMSFWIHGDAAWGGYVRSLFMGHEIPESLGGELPELNRFYHEAMGMSEEIELKLDHPSDGRVTEQIRKVQVDWNDLEVYSAFLALGSADSITIDPHKLGFVPYPAGIVAFRRELVTDLIVQRAQYISEDAAGIDGIEQDIEIMRVGPYILEGSKPGAAAASCWLAHKTIPLDKDGHGKIIRESMLNTKKLARYISMHHKIFDSIELEFKGEPTQRFSFELVAEPDTNIVCFMCVPLKGDRYDFDDSWSLEEINRFNLAIYERATIKNPPHVHKMPYGQEFFVSRTVLTTEQYRTSSVKGLLEKYDWSAEDYERNGIFVLRSTVMNPWHRLAEEKGKNYLFDFVVDLHRIAREEVGRAV